MTVASAITQGSSRRGRDDARAIGTGLPMLAAAILIRQAFSYGLYCVFWRI